MKVRNLVILAAALLLAPSSSRAQAPGLPAQVVRINPVVSTATYPMLDYGSNGNPANDKQGTTTWRIVKGTGTAARTTWA